MLTFAAVLLLLIVVQLISIQRRLDALVKILDVLAGHMTETRRIAALGHDHAMEASREITRFRERFDHFFPRF